MLDVIGSGRAFAAFNGEQRVTRWYHNRCQAQSAAERLLRRSRQLRRPCLCCGAKFTSEGPHNRLCNQCRREG
ncbi:hypothetical protein SAMN05444007_108218 [Cribrihabitans marinus]|uniref:Uncharacterized protein n=1 Tax=Cribrihabitans marinus TaxID=1227549 RepID=A0A1H7CNH2_9RHOB|nr:hypothetical protein [Cribrihabitans marinus]GGH36095.1 hypothetical protein GCM10010973_29860 [Cribrihabitans marinus]SEJ91006.1 hypothetical protein SAMN05444007_108218 [Cribrihabitans marinus]